MEIDDKDANQKEMIMTGGESTKNAAFLSVSGLDDAVCKLADLRRRDFDDIADF